MRSRPVATAAYAVLLVAWCWLVGIPKDPAGVLVWIWLGTVAWDAEQPWRHHLGFWRDWWKPLLVIVFYWVVRGLADEVGIAPHYTMPIRVDEWLASLVGSDGVPTVTLQDAWCGDPCTGSLPPRWWDVVFTTVYTSHFVVALGLAGVLWRRNRLEWERWLRRYLTLLLAGLAIYVAYPMVPPWMAARDGYLPDVGRITDRGWSPLELHGVDLHRQSMIMFGMGNKVAAMPSLHAGIAFLVAIYLVGRLRSPARWLLLAYPLTMSLALVYFAEHYVVDTIAGGLLALVVALACRRWERVRAA